MSLLSTHVPASLTGAEDIATSPDMSVTRIRGTLTEDGATILPRLGDEREGTSVGSRQRNQRHERSVGMASVDHVIRSKNSAVSAKSHERNPQNVKTFLSELTACEIALDESQENIRKWESTSGDRFNVSMKKVVFLDKRHLHRCESHSRTWGPSNR